MKKTFNALLFILVAAISQAQPVKKILLEEFTTSLCGMCPPQSYNILQYHEQHLGSSVFLTIHEGFGTDAMSGPFLDSIEQEFANPAFGFAPAVMIDRVTYPWIATEPYMSVNGFDSIADRVANETPRVAVDISGTYNSSNRQIAATVTASFLQQVASGNYRISLYLVEDSLIGSGSGWDQKCYDASFANTHYPGQYNSSTDLISGYPHRHVLRAALAGGSWGSAGIIPSSPVLGTPYTVNVNYTVPANYDASRLSLIAFVAHYAAASSSSAGNGNRWVLNANATELTPVFATAVDQQTALSQDGFDLFPNPARDQVSVQFNLAENSDATIRVLDMNGKIVFEEKAQAYAQGTHNLFINTQQLPKGLYMVQLLSPAGFMVKKLVVQ